MKNFTGISDPYEPPLHAEIVIQTQKESEQESAARILGSLERMGLIEPAHEPAYTSVEAEKIRERLEKLGYIEK